ncbi:tyrosine-type recombinase/integrase [Paracoccus yibinensis]|uniref:tyrosine-type recombinase/integrase n=1 Tax=Paracoccus yibinensis TaxID=3068891 RepID=UPI00358F367B
MPEFWTWLCEVPCGEVIRQMAMLIVLTAKRTCEARFARFDEIDAEMATWTTPAEKMKMRQEHRVPLSHQALIVHENLRCLNGGRDYLFFKARTKSGVLSEKTVLKLVQRFDPEITGHGVPGDLQGVGAVPKAVSERCYRVRLGPWSAAAGGCLFPRGSPRGASADDAGLGGLCRRRIRGSQ